MNSLQANFGHSHNHAGFNGLAICKQILNRLSTLSTRSVVRGRFAALNVRALDDIGLTIAERDDMLR
jgi:hypothetical protein